MLSFLEYTVIIVNKHIICPFDQIFHYYRRDYVILGGTGQEGNWSTVINQQDKDKIWESCVNLVPSLKVCLILFATYMGQMTNKLMFDCYNRICMKTL